MGASLKIYYEPKVGGRQNALLLNVLNPVWPAIGEFEAAFLSWENEVVQYEIASEVRLSNPIKIAVVMKHAPNDVQQMLRSNSHVYDQGYQRMRRMIFDFLASSKQYNPQAASKSAGAHATDPMQVDAVKGKDKGKWGKWGKKGKDKGGGAGKG